MAQVPGDHGCIIFYLIALLLVTIFFRKFNFA